MGGSPWDAVVNWQCGACCVMSAMKRRPEVTVQCMPLQRARVRRWYALALA